MKNIIIGFSIICSCIWPMSVSGQTKTSDKKSDAPGLVVQMEPYVVKADRVLPNPEQWTYVKVPALILSRGKSGVIAPGYEMLSNLNSSQTKVLVDELQLRQFAATYLWPMLTQALPRTPVYVVVDINQQLSGGFRPLTQSDTWEGEQIVATDIAPAPSNFNSFREFGIQSSQSFAAEYGLGQMDEMDQNTEPETTVLEDASVLTGQKTERYREDETVIKPLGDGYVVLTANGGPLAALVRAGSPFGGAARPSEERFAATLSYELNRFALNSLPLKPPAWFTRGMSSLLGSTQVSYKLIQFALVRENLANREIPKLSKLFQNEDSFTEEEARLASLFVHMGLFGDNNKYTARFMQFVDRLAAGEQPTDAMFKQVFGMSMGKMETNLAVYARDMAFYKSRDIKGDIPTMPKPTYREATQSEVARIKAEVYISQSNPGRALEELRTAYWRGEREPSMMAMIATLELQAGSEARARKIVNGLMEMKTPPPQTYLVSARLQIKDMLAVKPADAKLNAEETSSIIATLSGALAGGLTTEDLCSTLAEVFLKSSIRPDANTTAFLQQASKRYPKNQTIAGALAQSGSS